MIVGWWAEASWSTYNEKAGVYSNQEIVNLGLDYTFGVGKGLIVIYEQLIATHDQEPFAFKNTAAFSLLSFSV